MGNKQRTIHVSAEENECPADALMNDFRRRVNLSNGYSKNVEFSKQAISFFRDKSDITEENEQIIKFYWDEIKEEGLPPLIVKIRKKGNRFFLQYLKEKGKPEMTISGKQRKGKNKSGEKIIIVKESVKGEER